MQEDIKPKKGEIALIDMDGTIADYYSAIRTGLEKLASPNEPTIPIDIHKCPTWLENRIDLIKSQDGFWRNLPPIKEGLLVVKILDQLGYTNIVLTKGPNRTRSAWTEKAQWCDEHMKGSALVMVDAKTPEEHKALVYGRVLFDDFPAYVEAWLKVRPRGKVIMLERSYNKDFKHDRVLKIGNSAFNKLGLEISVKNFLLKSI